MGSLMYASLGTCPDVMFAVQTLSRFAKNPGLAHWDAVKRVFQYLKGTHELWLSYGGTKNDLEGYADADGSMMEDRRAVSGYAFVVYGGAVLWSAKRQEIVSLSTTESEYIAATYATKEALWLRTLISQIFGPALPATTLYLVCGLDWGRVRLLAPDPTPVHNPYPSNSGRVLLGVTWGMGRVPGVLPI